MENEATVGAACVINESDVFKNKINSIISHTARTVAMMCASGPLMQSFLSLLGFDSSLIYIHSSLIQATNVITIMLASGWSRRGCPIKRSALTAIPTALLFLLYIPIAIARSASMTAYALLVAIAILHQMTVGLYTVLEYKMPYYIYRVEEYGRMLSICGIVSYFLTLGSGMLVSYLTARFDFIVVMTYAFLASGLLMGVVFVFTLMQKSLLTEEVETPRDNKNEGQGLSVLRLFRTPAFSKLIHANLLRGFAAGTVGVLATVALDLGYGENVTTAMVSVSSVASLVACALFAITAKRINPGIAVAVGGAMVASMPVMLIRGDWICLAVYGVVLFGRTLVDYAVPAMLIKVVPVNIAGPYHAWRMVLQHAGSLIATSVAAMLPPWLMLALSALFTVVSSLSFYAVGKKYEK